MSKEQPSVKALKRQRTELISRLPELSRVLRGSLVERYKKCGKPGCRCARGERHGPAYYLSVTLAPGKTRSYYIPVKLRGVVEEHLLNHRKMRDLLEELTRINRQLLEQGALDEGS